MTDELKQLTDAEIDELITVSTEANNNPATRRALGQLATEVKKRRPLEGALRAENARLREALEFYAKSENYWEEIKDHIFRTTPIREDAGKIAQQALKETV